MLILEGDSVEKYMKQLQSSSSRCQDIVGKVKSKGGSVVPTTMASRVELQSSYSSTMANEFVPEGTQYFQEYPEALHKADS